MKKHIVIVLLFFVLAILIKLTGIFEGKSIFCIEKEEFKTKIFNCIIIDKYIDSSNHCFKALLLEDLITKKTEKIYIINENSGFYERARVNDTLFKEKNSLDIIINNEKSIHRLKYDCDE